jgi:hypothetical protein
MTSTSDPQFHALLWMGTTLMLIVTSILLVPLWVQALKRTDEETHPLVFPAVMTGLLVIGFTMATLGETVTSQGPALHDTTASQPSPAFVEQVKQDAEAVKPQTREELAKEREAKAAKKAEETLTEHEKFQKAREEIMNKGQ